MGRLSVSLCIFLLGTGGSPGEEATERKNNN